MTSEQLDIFLRNKTGHPISFCTKDLHLREHVDEEILKYNGEVTDMPSDFTVSLVSKIMVECSTLGMDLPYNTFSIDYIKDCVQNMKLQPLKDYWVHKALDFDDENFDPDDVMHGIRTWEECKKQVPMNPPSGVTSTTGDSDDELFYSYDSLTRHPQHTHPKARQPYTEEERNQLLQYIYKVNGYHRTNGNTLWKEMEAEKVCSGRSWQSLKEHFRRYIKDRLCQFPSYLTDGLQPASKQAGKRKEKVQNENEDGSLCQHQNDAEGMVISNDSSQSHAVKEEILERNESDIIENESGMGSPSLLPAHSNFERQSIPQESQGFGVGQLFPMVLEADVSNSRSNKGQQLKEEQQESASSIELLDPEENIYSGHNAESQLHISTNNSNNSDHLLSPSSQQEQQAPLTVPSLIPISEVIEETNLQSLTMNDDTPEAALCANSISLDHMRVRCSPSQSVTREGSKTSEGNVSKENEEMEVMAGVLGKEMQVSSLEIECSAINTSTRTTNNGLPKGELTSKMPLSFATSGGRRIHDEEEEEEEEEAEELEDKEGKEHIDEEEEEEEEAEELEDEEQIDEEEEEEEEAEELEDKEGKEQIDEEEEEEEDMEQEKEQKKKRSRSCHPPFRQQTEVITRRKRHNSTCSSSDENDSPEPKQQPYVCKKMKKTLPKQTRASGVFTVEEDLDILHYIEEHDAYSRVGGKALWEEMSSNFVSGRTWQSLKERFRKRIMTSPRTYIAHGMSRKSISKFEDISNKTGSGRDRKQKKCVQKQRQPLQTECRAKANQGRKTKKGCSPKSQEKGFHCQQIGKPSSGIKQTKYGYKQHHTDSEESVSEEESPSPNQPNHSKENHQKQHGDPPARIAEHRVMTSKTTRKVNTATATLGKLKKIKNTASLSRNSKSDFNKFELLKQKIIYGREVRKSRSIPRLGNDSESDCSVSLPDLSFEASVSPDGKRSDNDVENEEEMEEDANSEISNNSKCLFDIESESE